MVEITSNLTKKKKHCFNFFRKWAAFLEIHRGQGNYWMRIRYPRSRPQSIMESTNPSVDGFVVWVGTTMPRSLANSLNFLNSRGMRISFILLSSIKVSCSPVFSPLFRAIQSLKGVFVWILYRARKSGEMSSSSVAGRSHCGYCSSGQFLVRWSRQWHRLQRKESLWGHLPSACAMSRPVRIRQFEQVIGNLTISTYDFQFFPKKAANAAKVEKGTTNSVSSSNMTLDKLWHARS